MNTQVDSSLSLSISLKLHKKLFLKSNSIQFLLLLLSSHTGDHLFLTLGISYNRPKFCPNASWHSEAITFANSSDIGSDPFAIFISVDNSVYAYDRSSGGGGGGEFGCG